jgi:heavy metal efflux system protein
MGGLIRFALSQRILILLAVFLLAGGGFYAFKTSLSTLSPKSRPHR